MLARVVLDSPVGTLQLVASLHGLRAVLWPDDDPERVPIGSTQDAPDHPSLVEAAEQLAEYFAGTRTKFSVALDPVGTPFQRAVWAELTTIPFGATVTYSELAGSLGRPTATRAVGSANGRNPLSIVVPCHRVIGSNGALVGFAGGVATKKWLLAHEATVLAERSA